MLTVAEYLTRCLAEKKVPVLELYTESGLLERAFVTAVSPTNHGHALIAHGLASRQVHISNIVFDRMAGTACYGRWCLSAADRIIYNMWKDNDIQPEQINRKLRALQKKLPGSEIARVTRWDGIKLDNVVAFLDVAYSNDDITAHGYLIYKDGSLSGFLVAPDDALFEHIVE